MMEAFFSVKKIFRLAMNPPNPGRLFPRNFTEAGSGFIMEDLRIGNLA